MMICGSKSLLGAGLGLKLVVKNINNVINPIVKVELNKNRVAFFIGLKGCESIYRVVTSSTGLTAAPNIYGRIFKKSAIYFLRSLFLNTNHPEIAKTAVVITITKRLE